MKSIPWTQFKRMTTKEIMAGQCVEVTSDGEHAFYALVGVQGQMQHQIVARAQLVDAGRGVDNAPSSGESDEAID